jgi:ribosomal protein S8
MVKIDLAVLCTKISIIKLSLAIVRILVEYGYIEDVDPQGLRRNCYQVFQD